MLTGGDPAPVQLYPKRARHSWHELLVKDRINEIRSAGNPGAPRAGGEPIKIVCLNREYMVNPGYPDLPGQRLSERVKNQLILI
jgi:hypothetical protein